MFENKQNSELLATFNIGDSARYVHFHDFIDDIAFIGCMTGNLNVLTLSDETLKQVY